jgi:peptidoglycan/LPS O-acetylase OafA/YrhL
MVRAPRVCGIVGADMHHTSNTLPMATAIEVPPYRALGWMRFALAMTVVMNGHSAWLAPDNAFVQWLAWMRGGGIAVMVFFIISGYVITEAAATFYKSRPTAFAKNRLLKIYPAYLAALFVAIAAHAILYFDGRLEAGMSFEGYKNFSEIWRLGNMLWQPFAVVPPFNRHFAESLIIETAYPFVRYLWAINVEMAFYMVALAGILVMMRRQPLSDRNVLVATTAFCVAYIATAFLRLPEVLTFYTQNAPAFLLGALLWRWQRDRSPIVLRAVAICIATLMVHMATSEKYTASGAPWFFRFAVVMVLVAIIVRCAQIRASPAFRTVDRQLGDLSYAAYLNHYSVMILLSGYLAADQRGAAYWLLNGVLVVLLSIVMQRLVEKPLASFRARVRGTDLTRLG